MPGLVSLRPQSRTGVKVAVPAFAPVAHGFVLHEQHDWFEDAIRFIGLTRYSSGMLGVDTARN